jgi:hypothetical protein
MTSQYIASAVDALLEYAQKQSKKEGLNFSFKVLEKTQEAKAFVGLLGFDPDTAVAPTVKNDADFSKIIAGMRDSLDDFITDMTRYAIETRKQGQDTNFGSILSTYDLVGCFNALTLAVYWLEHYKKMKENV